MLLRDRPLLQDPIDEPIYLARPTLEEPLLRALRQERNALLSGAWGSGKTTLARRVEAELKKSGRRTVWINGRLAEDAEGLLREVEGILRDPEGEQSKVEPSPDPRPPGLLSAARAIGTLRPAVIIVDDLRDQEVGFDLFGRLRDELWAAPHVWLVIADSSVAAGLQAPPAGAFWSRVVEIPPLDADQVQKLLRKGLDPEERKQVSKGGAAIAGVNPRELIREVERIVEGDAERESRPLVELIDEASRIGRSEAMAMTELIGLGRPASVHDEELLERLGWSRAYAQRIFASLESAHLVRSLVSLTKEPGRPRKVYEPNPRAFR
jgi:predicted transcriptional regulator